MNKKKVKFNLKFSIAELAARGGMTVVDIIQSRVSVLFVLLLLVLTLLTGCGTYNSSAVALPENNNVEQEIISVRNDPIWSDEKNLRAMIISDLHYTENKDANPAIVPGIALAEEITDVIVAQVIDMHPDVLIMTGDNTDTGRAEDASGLVQRLQKIRDNGIPIILTTGNHDFNHMTAEEFEDAYFGLLNPVDRAPDSLSYTAIVKDVVFLVMDDNYLYGGAHGEFSGETLRWLSEMLEKYRDHTVVFLSHHNVLYGRERDGSGSNLIQNPELPDILIDGGVRLALTGHMHLQYITKQDGLWEILSGMPFSGGHLIGNLAVGADRLLYYAEPIDIERYNSSVVEILGSLDASSADHISSVFSKVLDKEGLRGRKRKRVQELLDRFFLYYGQGTLPEHKRQLMEDPYYEQMIDALWDYNYGPWVKEMIEKTKYSGRKLEVSW